MSTVFSPGFLFVRILSDFLQYGSSVLLQLGYYAESWLSQARQTVRRLLKIAR